MPLAATGAVALLAACGNTPAPSAQPAADQGTTTLSQADLGKKAQEALTKKGTFHVESKTAGDEPSTLIADVKLGGAKPEFLITADKTTVMGVGGQLYGQGEGFADGTHWVKDDPSKTGIDALNGTMMRLIAWQAQPQQLLAGTPYATKFETAAGPQVDGAATTQYKLTIDLAKATQANAFGDYITAESLKDEKDKTLTATVLLDGDSLPRKIDYTLGEDGGSSTFTKFGDPVVLAAPKIDEVAK
jgi:hypothetical protein